MYSLNTAKTVVVYGLVLAGAAGLCGNALAASDHDQAGGMSDSGQGASNADKELSNRIEEYNENRGSRDRQNVRETGDVSSSVSEKAKRNSEDLSERAERYNKNGGSRDRASAADKMGSEAGDVSSDVSQKARKKSEKLSNRVDQYNENKGSRDSNSATERDMGNDETDSE